MSDEGRKVRVYLITAPIGDFLGDMSVNAFETLKRLEVVFVEDTGSDDEGNVVEKLRRKGVLTDAHELIGISCPEDTVAKLGRVDELVARGTDFAILADKGLPCFIDPGREIVEHLLEKHADAVRLIPIGTSSAVDATVAMSGTNCTMYAFLGHFPEEYRLDDDITGLDMPLIYYVRGDSLTKFVDILQARLGKEAESLEILVFRNIRHRKNVHVRLFRLDEPVASFEHFVRARDGPGPDVFSDNFTVMLRRAKRLATRPKKPLP